MIYDQCQTIEDLPKFIESHERFIAALKPGKARVAYQTRLDKVRQLLSNEHIPTNPQPQ